MVNGYAASSADWDPRFLDLLGAKARLILPDNRGIGNSGGDPAEIGLETMVDDLLALLDQLEINSVNLLGWSMGGFVAQALAARRPDRVRSLILLSTDPGGEFAVCSSAAISRQLTDQAGTAEEQARRLIGLLFPAALAADIFKNFGDSVAEARSLLRPEILDAQVELIDRWHKDPSATRLAEIKAPTLVGAGELDQIIPATNAGRLSQHIDGARAEVFAGGGHAFLAQFPKPLAQMICEFIGATDQPPRRT